MTNSPEIIENPSETQTRAETALSLQPLAHFLNLFKRWTWTKQCKVKRAQRPTTIGHSANLSYIYYTPTYIYHSEMGHSRT